jgi:hypothetical protein
MAPEGGGCRNSQPKAIATASAAVRICPQTACDRTASSVQNESLRSPLIDEINFVQRIERDALFASDFAFMAIELGKAFFKVERQLICFADEIRE